MSSTPWSSIFQTHFPSKMPISSLFQGLIHSHCFLFENVWKVLLLLPLYPQFLVLSFSSFSSLLNQYFHQAVFPASPDKVISINYTLTKHPTLLHPNLQYICSYFGVCFPQKIIKGHKCREHVCLAYSCFP